MTIYYYPISLSGFSDFATLTPHSIPHLRHIYLIALVIIKHHSQHYSFLYHRPSTFLTMVHLTSVPNDSAAEAPLVKGLENIKLEQPGEDEATVSVYGSRFAGEEMPNHSFPDQEMYATVGV